MRVQMTGVVLAIIGGAVATIAGGVAFAWQTSSGSGSAQQMIDNARPGQAITLPAGNQGTLLITNRTFAQPIRINASASRFSAIVIRSSRGVQIDGGTVIGPGGRSYGVTIDRSTDVRISNMSITGAHRGIVVGVSSGIALVGNQLAGLISDGINIARSQRVVVDGNRCRDFRPNVATFSSDGDRIQDGDHPDCIQAWSRPTAAPVSDLTIVNNDAEGQMQGVFLGNGVRNGIDDGGFDRVTIRNNIVRVTMSNGIAISGARGLTVTGNVVETLPGSRSIRPPYNPVRTSLRISGSTGVRACGNRVPAVPTAVGTQACR